jgi:hypothetical protein
MATPTPPGGIPDPRGLWTAALVGTVFTHDPFFAIAVFALVHYISVWPVNPVSLMGPGINFVFIVRMLVFVVYGTIGYTLAWAMKSPVLFPTQLSDRRHSLSTMRFTPAAYILALSITFGLWSVLVFTQYYFRLAPWGIGILGITAHVAWGIVGFLFFVAFILTILVFTWIGKESVMTLRYNGESARGGWRGQLLVWYVVLLVLLLGPQAIWDFLTPPTGAIIPFWASGLITVAVEALIYVAAYFFLTRVYDIDNSGFSKQYSGVNIRNFLIILGSVQVGTGLLYILVGSFTTTFEQLDWLMLGLTLIVAIVAIIVSLFLPKRGRDGDSRQRLGSRGSAARSGRKRRARG